MNLIPELRLGEGPRGTAANKFHFYPSPSGGSPPETRKIYSFCFSARLCLFCRSFPLLSSSLYACRFSAESDYFLLKGKESLQCGKMMDGKQQHSIAWKVVLTRCLSALLSLSALQLRAILGHTTALLCSLTPRQNLRQVMLPTACTKPQYVASNVSAAAHRRPFQRRMLSLTIKHQIARKRHK